MYLLIQGPIASLFWLDSELCSDIFLDGIVTIVDAKHGLRVGHLRFINQSHTVHITKDS